jgi:hypothetical protein
MGFLIGEINAEHKIKFGIATTIECYSIPPAASARDIPFICLVNEYAGIYASKAYFDISLLWSDCSFFSSKFLLSQALNELNTFKGEGAYVLPQGKCDIPTASPSKMLEGEGNKNYLEWTRFKESLNQSKLILGIGSINYRKGVDLFIQCAFELSGKESGSSFKFLWIGDGMQDAGTATYPIFLLDQIKQLGLTNAFKFIGSIDSLEDVYKAAAVILIPSRVDPLPNVGIDAMAIGLPFVYFDGATGISDALIDLVGMRAEAYKAHYLDVKDMAEKAYLLVTEPDHSLVVDIKNKVSKAYCFDAYAEKLEAIYPDIQLKSKNLRNDLKEILGDYNFRPDFFSRDPKNTIWPNENLVRFYIKCWSAKMDRRKPFPGFNPGIYSEVMQLRISDGDPYAHYLRAGSPDGRWRSQVISPSSSRGEMDASLPHLSVALHIHAYYPELFPSILERLLLNTVKPDLFISVGSGDHIPLIREYLQVYTGKVKKIVACPNLGRDIGPLITEFGREIVNNYKYFGHLHTKATNYLDDPTSGQVWYSFLLENLLGGQGGAMADAILSAMLQSPELDLVFPDDPNLIGWDANRAIAEMLASKMGILKLTENFNFPVGTMFWAKSEVLKKLLDLNLTWTDYPNEPLAYDGTILHAIERIIPFLTSSPTGRYALTNVPGITR